MHPRTSSRLPGRWSSRPALLAAAAPPLHGQDGFRFKSGVELVNVNITVTDRSGRFVEGLRQEKTSSSTTTTGNEITHFSAERVPVSLGVALDTSGSMVGDKIESARAAIDRFLLELLGPDDEVFLMRFGASAELVHDWTQDKALVSRRLARVNPAGGTAMYDALAESVPIAMQGQHRKKAILVISDGNDTNSQTSVSEVKQMIRETEVLVYAVGIDGRSETTFGTGRSTPPVVRQPPVRLPFPFPGGGGRGGGRGSPWPGGGFPGGGGGGGGRVYGGGAGNDDRVNVGALREITDDSGGRTEIGRTARDLDPATENIADELSKQYYLGYPAPGHKDGRWHTIRVEVNRPGYLVRARRGYTAAR
ncbi:MAG: VWA domain-containing protein [Vicinamibacterales bacterium]